MSKPSSTARTTTARATDAERAASTLLKVEKEPTLTALRAEAKSRGMAGLSKASREEILEQMAEWDRIDATRVAVEPDAEAEGIADAEKQLQAMTVAQLREYARNHEMSTITKLTKKSELIPAILSFISAKEKVATRPVTFPEPSPVDVALDEVLPVKRAEKIAETHGDALSDGGQKSLSKATAFIADANGLGWELEKTGSQDPAHWGVTVARGQERIEIEWLGGVFQGDTCYYSHPARTPIKLRNASHAKKQMAIAAATADEEARKVSAHKVTRPARRNAAEATTERRKALPFDPETATDAEVCSAVANRSISWTNEISGAIEDAYVITPAANIRVTPGTSGRSVGFVSETGFRSVRVSSIVAVR